MAFNLKTVLKGLLLRQEGTLTPSEIAIVPGGDASTRTTVQSSQTAPRTLTLPDADDTLVGRDTIDTLTQKSIDADDNTITNLENDNIKALAAIDATKIADGTVENAEFQRLNGVTSPIQTQLNTNATDIANHIADPTAAHAASAVSVVPTGNLVATDVQSALVELQGDIDGINVGVPTGAVLPFAGVSAPVGYLLCDGSAVSRVTFSALFAVLSTSHGQGDGSTTFNLPDYRGRFIRGVNGAATNDPDSASRTAMATGGNTGNNVGSVQGHAFQTHTHVQDAHTHLQNAHTHPIIDPQHSHNALIVRDAGGSGTPGQFTAAVINDNRPGFPNNTVDNDVVTTQNASTNITVDNATATNQNTTATNQNATASGATAQASANETRPVNAYVNFIIKT